MVAAAGWSLAVPGVMAVAAPVYAGIPVTHRTIMSTVTFVTGFPMKDRSHIEDAIGDLVHGTWSSDGMTNLPNIVQCAFGLKWQGGRDVCGCHSLGT